MTHVGLAVSTIVALSLLVLGSSLFTLGRNVLYEAHAAIGPDFGMASSTSSLMVTLGSSGTVTITVTSLNGFTGNVDLSGVVSPPGLASSLSPQTVSLASGASQTSALTVSTIGVSPLNAIDRYSINVTGSSGTIAHSIIVALTVSSPSSGLRGILSLVAVAVLGVAVVLIVYFAGRKSVKN